MAETKDPAVGATVTEKAIQDDAMNLPTEVTHSAEVMASGALLAQAAAAGQG